MNRRGLLKALGLGAAALPAVGPAQAAKIVGLDMDMQTPLSDAIAEAACGPSPSGWWGSPLQIAFDAQREAQYSEGKRFSHMKSWAPHYRVSAEARENAAMRLLQQNLEQDEQMRAKLLALLGHKGGSA